MTNPSFQSRVGDYPLVSVTRGQYSQSPSTSGDTPLSDISGQTSPVRAPRPTRTATPDPDMPTLSPSSAVVPTSSTHADSGSGDTSSSPSRVPPTAIEPTSTLVDGDTTTAAVTTATGTSTSTIIITTPTIVSATIVISQPSTEVVVSGSQTGVGSTGPTNSDGPSASSSSLAASPDAAGTSSANVASSLPSSSTSMTTVASITSAGTSLGEQSTLQAVGQTGSSTFTVSHSIEPSDNNPHKQSQVHETEIPTGQNGSASQSSVDPSGTSAAATSSNPSHAMPPEEIAAICITVVVVVLVCATSLYLWRTRRKREARRFAPPSRESTWYGGSATHLRPGGTALSDDGGPPGAQDLPLTLDIRASYGTYSFPLPPSHDARHASGTSRGADSLTLLIPAARDPFRAGNRRLSALSQESFPLPSSTYMDPAMLPADWTDAWNLPRPSSELVRGGEETDRDE
ncbi:hypothetical protein BD413DRAFT_495938 [Trametes elegans]|nr:hypothetical protein BD413DRAFT_495938 [Trametes elegans]